MSRARALVEEKMKKPSKAAKLNDIAYGRYGKPYSQCSDAEQAKCEDAFNSVFDDESYEQDA